MNLTKVEATVHSLRSLKSKTYRKKKFRAVTHSSAVKHRQASMMCTTARTFFEGLEMKSNLLETSQYDGHMMNLSVTPILAFPELFNNKPSFWETRICSV